MYKMHSPSLLSLQKITALLSWLNSQHLQTKKSTKVVLRRREIKNLLHAADFTKMQCFLLTYFVGRYSSERLSYSYIRDSVSEIHRKCIKNPWKSHWSYCYIVSTWFTSFLSSFLLEVRCMHVSSIKYRAKHVRMIETLGTNRIILL